MASRRSADVVATFEACLFVLIGVLALTGIWLAFPYDPTRAHQSVTEIHANGLLRVVAGWHHWAAVLLIVMSCVHLAVLVHLGRYRSPHRWSWYAAVAIALASLKLITTGNLLLGDSHGVQTAVIESALVGQVPFFGEWLKGAFLGGEAFGTHTVVWWANTHIFLVPGVVGAFLLFASWFRTPRLEGETRWKAAVAPTVLALVAALFWAPPIGSSATLADHASFNAMPSWYVWPMHATLRAVESVLPGWGWLGAGIVPVVALAFLLALPSISERVTGILVTAVFWFGVLAVLVVTAVFGGPAAMPWSRPDPKVPSLPQQAVFVPISNDLAEQGKELFQTKGCTKCHGIDGTPSASGPDLTNVHKGHANADWFFAFIKEPAKIRPNTVMPSFRHLRPEQIRAIAEFLRQPR